MNTDTQEIRLAPQPAPKHGPWYLLTGLILGFLIGLIYAWLINPIVYESTHPASLKDAYKDTYRSTIAQVFEVTGNLERAALRLDLLNDEDPIHALGAQAQRALAAGDGEEAHALALLASALQSKKISPEKPPTTEPIQTSTPTIQAIPTQTLSWPTPTP